MSTMMYGKIQKMTVALLTAFMILAYQCLPALASSMETAQVRSAPMTSDAKVRDGMVRVYLSSLGNPSALDLTVKGNYSFSHSGEYIASGSKLKVGFSSSNGNLTLTYQGQTYQMGRSFSLRRHSASGSNGILISQSRDSQNPYPGDLSFEAVSNGGTYTLYVVAHVYIEDYLYGVLPYEMGNASGMEALKAQAVAARTYTVRMMENRSTWRYDVKDTTSDQTYRGTPSGNANCVAAVNATKGIVLMYGSSYITTYYSASNGGQTEKARTGASYAYMQVKDDPFDYANPSSTVKKKTIYTDLSKTANPSGLISLLKNKAVDSLKSKGYPATPENTALKTLQNVTPHTPMYASPSRLYTKMDFTFTASTVNASGQGALETLTATCGIFTELESMLGMGIQSSNNELWSVEKGNGTFVLQARRFGHGMGMSQRGAMQMAKLGYSYDQILGFYYDGCKRVQHSFTSSILHSSSDDEQITVQPPADMEDTDSNASIGTVLLTGNSAQLAIRSSASSDAAVIGTAGNGARVEVLSQQNGWCQVRFGEIVGYVPAASLSVSGTIENQQQESSKTLGFAVVTANDFVNLREKGSMNAKILGTAPAGAVLTVFSKSGSWARVQYQSLPAYVNTNYISSVSSDYPSDDLTSGSRKAMVVTPNGTGTVNLRQSASTGAKLLDRLNVGTVVMVLSDDGSWCRIRFGSDEGYMLATFLKYVDEEIEDGASEDQTAEDDPSDEDEPSDENEPPVTEDKEEDDEPASTLNAVVTTQSGSLNLRAAAASDSRILTTIPRGTQISVLARGETWSAVQYNLYQGFVMNKFLTFASDPPAPDEPPSEQDKGEKLTAVVTTSSGTLNLRAAPNTGSQIYARIPRLTRLEVLAKESEWSKVVYLNTTGYVMNSFLTFDHTASEGEGEPQDSSPANGESKEDAPQAAANHTAMVNTQSGSLNLRGQPSLNAVVLTSIPRKASVTVTAYGDSWCAVEYGSYAGYVMTLYLQFADEKTDAPEKENEPSKDPPTEDGSHEEGEEPQNPYITIGGVVLDVTLEAPPSAMYAVSNADTALFTMCAETADRVIDVSAGEKLEILLVGKHWCRVAYQEEQGYCPTDRLDVRESNE